MPALRASTMSMPKAPIHEHNRPEPTKDNIRLARELRVV